MNHVCIVCIFGGNLTLASEDLRSSEFEDILDSVTKGFLTEESFVTASFDPQVVFGRLGECLKVKKRGVFLESAAFVILFELNPLLLLLLMGCWSVVNNCVLLL